VYKILLSISLLLAPLASSAQTASDYFHRGAQFYIFGKKQEAKNEVLTGLRLFPDDQQLNGLAALLKKEEEQQQQQKQQQQQQQQNDQSKQDQNQQGQQSQQNQQKEDSQNQKNQDQSKQQQQADKDQNQKQQQAQQQQAAQQAGSTNQDSEPKEGEESYAAGQMTPEQARQLLDSQKGEEKMLQMRPDGKPADRRRPVRDW